jgi:transposase-like protein
MSSKVAQLIDLVRKMPEDCVDEAIAYVQEKIEKSEEKKPKPPCPHCNDDKVLRNGRKEGRQRYICKGCGKTFAENTNTAISQSHFGEGVWKQVISDTLSGVSLDETAGSIYTSHSTVFNMRHKILLSLEAAQEREPTILDGVCELDDTYVLESRKGSKLSDGYWRGARKHGACAQSAGVSREHVAICAGVGRDGSAYCQTVNRATPGKKDFERVFGQRIGGEALILYHGAPSYAALGKSCDCPVKNVSEEGSKSGKGFYHINTANGFHSFIKQRYYGYRGVATKYLNRYNTLFAKLYRNDADLVDAIYKMLISPAATGHRTVHAVVSQALCKRQSPIK